MIKGLIFSVLFSSLSIFAQNIPTVNSPVYDENNYLSKMEAIQLDSEIRTLYKSGGPQIQILFVKSLQGFTIEQYSIKAGEALKMGNEEKDNGIILIVAKKERKIRIEVGSGIEGEVTDYESFKIIKTVLTPYFKRGNFFKGSMQFVYAIAAKFKVPMKRKIIRSRRYSDRGSLMLTLLLICVLLLGISLISKNLIFRGIFGALAGAGVSYMTFGLAIPYLLGLTALSVVISIIGPSNILIYSAYTRGGYYDGGSGGSGGGWSGGRGGFSGGGASGDF